MIDWLLIFGFLLGLLLRGLNHNCLVVAGHTRTDLVGRCLGGWVRAILIVFITILGIRHGSIFPDCYRVWWDSYFVQHSMVVWIGLACTPTVALYLLKEITFRVARDPHGYKLYDPGIGRPTLIRTSMKTAMAWYLIYWAWILFSPWLPFFRCFVQICFLRETSWVALKP